MSGPLEMLQKLEPESYWAEDYMAAMWPVLGQWWTRPFTWDDLRAVARCMDVVGDLDVTDNAPFAALWALRTTGALPPVGDLDERLTDWRAWIEGDYYDGESLDLPPLATSDTTQETKP